MSDTLLERLRNALGTSYQVLHEIGHGGMARVFLAQDIRHPRRVAIKVLYPELAAAIGSERFLREIGVTASLSHPHILPLIDSGQADGLPYYIMPFVEGESLRTRLERESMLSIEEAVDIARQVGEALAYAHVHGIVHRDIKPDNILLAGNQAVVADFGIAHAVADLGAERLTETGIAIGTVAYMSPEQAVADPGLDGRSDEYSLACVVYEMLVGQPPFTGRDSRAIVARHTLDPVPPLRTIRSTIPAAVERAVLKGLAKLPVDRFPTAIAFVDALKTGLAGIGPQESVQEPAVRRRPQVALVVLGAVALSVSAVLLGRACTDHPENLDANLVAVLPFRITGAVDTTLLPPEGIVDLLYTALSSGAPFQAVDPARTLRAWHRATDTRHPLLEDRAAIHLAQRLGAGKLLLGRLYGAGDSVTLSARLISVPAGQELAKVDRLSGPAADALGLLDQLCVQLLARGAGTSGPHLEDLYTRNLEAFREYMAGSDRYRRGQYEEAASHFQKALRLDSTFALAALDLGFAATMIDRKDLAEGAMDVAWAHRDRLGSSGRIFLRAMVGARYPERSSVLEDMRLWEATVDSIPERPEAWYALGDMLFHYGAAVGRQSARLLARNAFRRALESDSAQATVLEHLIDLAAEAGDTAELGRLARHYFAVDSLGDRADYVRWRVAVTLGDSVLHRQILNRLPQFSQDLLERVTVAAQLDATGLDDAVKASEQARAVAQDPSRLWNAIQRQRELALNMGQPSIAPNLPVNEAFHLPVAELFTVVSAIFWDGDSTAAAEAVARRRPEAGKIAQAHGDPESSAFMDNCTTGLWDAAAADWSRVTRAVHALAEARGIRPMSVAMYITICKAILDAQLAAGLHQPDALTSLTRLDSLMINAYPAGGPYLVLAGNLTASRLFENAGNLPAALAAVRRRTYLHDSFGAAGLSTMLREEGRLAALTGDREEAIRAYQHYLRLRRNAEPRLAPQVAEVRRALAELTPDRPR